VAAALVSDWFVTALEPAIDALGISQAFAGLVIVEIAGNAIENVVGIQLAARDQADFAMSVVIQSPLHIALMLAPAVVLLSLLTATTLTLVFASMLVVAVAVTVIAVAFIVFDGESTWLEAHADRAVRDHRDRVLIGLTDDRTAGGALGRRLRTARVAVFETRGPRRRVRRVGRGRAWRCAGMYPRRCRACARRCPGRRRSTGRTRGASPGNATLARQ
jgi:hypothetical protein